MARKRLIRRRSSKDHCEEPFNRLRYLEPPTDDRFGVIFDQDEALSRCRHVGYSPKAEVKSGYWHLLQWGFAG